MAYQSISIVASSSLLVSFCIFYVFDLWVEFVNNDVFILVCD